MKNQSPSYLLGQFVAMLQIMEESYQEHKQKGDDWGEQLLPLFHANFESTMSIGGKMMQMMPESVILPNGATFTLTEIIEQVQQIDLNYLEETGVETESYLQGYRNWRQGDAPVASDHSYNLGVFMATVTCMELAANEMSSFGIVEKPEDILLVLQVNFDSTMELVKQILTTLPKSATFNEKSISISEVVHAYSVLDLEHLAENPLNKELFLQGFQEQTSYYNSSPSEVL